MDEEFDWLSGPAALSQAYKERDFDAEFVSRIAKDVILVLSPQLLSEPHNSTCDDELVYTRLIAPLERFICDLEDDVSQENVKKVLDEVKSSDQPSKLCRRILKSGDVTFSCNDCALDSTCVVCIDCFLKGAHKDHNYRMSNSEGGGCCDCGDVEAWKQNHACADHLADNQPSISLSDFNSKELRLIQIDQDKKNIFEAIKRLPKKLATRYFLVCQASLRYALMILNWTDNDSLPPSLEVYGEMERDSELQNLLAMSKTKKNYFTVLFNDEVHTYDHVIATLVKIIKCSKMTASIIASTISREGRSLIMKDTQSNCEVYSTKISKVRDGTQGPLKVASIHGKILAHQAFAIKLVEWIRNMSSMGDGFRILTALTLLGTDGTSTMFERVALSNTKLWKIARVEWNDLFVKTLLTDYSIKQEVARLLTRNYPILLQDFIQDDHDHSVSILTLTTQIYTVPSLICMLVEEESALKIILGAFVEVCRAAKRENQATSFENRHTFDMMPIRRAYYAVHDFKYLINFQPLNWTTSLKKNVLEAMQLFLNLLESLQGMDSVKRQLGQHLEYEPDWESGMTLQGKLIHLIGRFIAFINYNEDVLMESVSETLTRLTRICRYKGYVARELFGHSANCINYDVTTMPVSIHLPLTRFAAALIVLLMQRRPCDKTPYDESLVISTNHPSNQQQLQHKCKISIIELMEPSLRAAVMIAQFRSGMWRRNGYSLVNQIINFQSPVMRREMFDRDILVLQECAVMSEPNEFMIHLINKFNLYQWITSDVIGNGDSSTSSSAASKTNDEELLAQTMSLGDEFLQLILIIISERYNVGIGKVEEEDIIKNEIIQLLCVSPMARSDLTNKLQVNDYELDCIKAVAELKRSSSTTTGKYELREEFYERFNPFFYHYNRRYQSNALDAQLKRKKNLGNQLICCPPPRPVELTKQFCNLNELLKCDILLVLIERVLTRCLNVSLDAKPASSESSTKTTTTTTTKGKSGASAPPKEPTKFGASELQLDQSLHLIGLGLWEQERDPMGFRFMDAAHSKGIFNLIRDIHEKGERNKDLLMWLMKKTDALADLINQRAQAGELVVDSSLEICADIKKTFMFALTKPDTTNQESKKHNSLLATQRRERIMAMMKANQEKFLSYQTTKELVAETERHEAPKVNLMGDLFQQASSATMAGGGSSSSGSSSALPLGRQRKTKPPKSIMGFASSRKMNKSVDQTSLRPVAPMLQQQQQAASDSSEQFVIDMDDDQMDQQQHLDDQQEQEELQQQLIVAPESSQMCILCRDEQLVGFDKPTMVLLAFVQRSAVLSRNRKQRRIPNYAAIPTNHMRSTLSNRNLYQAAHRYGLAAKPNYEFDTTFMPSDLFFSPHISTCGHVMHYDCWRGHTDAVMKRETSRLNRSSRHASFEPDKQEILCPLCDCISNAIIPLLPNYTTFAQRYQQAPGGIPESVFNLAPEWVDRSSSRQLSAFLTAIRSSVDTLKQTRHIKEFCASSNQQKIIHNSPTTPSTTPTSTPMTTATGSSSSSSSLLSPTAAAIAMAAATAAARTSAAHSDPFNSEKHYQLYKPRPLNDVLVELDETGALGLRNYIDTVRSNRISASSCSKTLLNSMTALCERIYLVGLDMELAMDHRTFDMTSWSVAYTLQTYERSSRFKGSPIFDDLESSSKSIGLSSLLRYAFASIMTQPSDLIQSLLVQKLRYLMVGDSYSSSPSCCLDIDAYETLVSLMIMFPKLYIHIDDQQWITQALDNEYNRNLIHLMLLLNLVQICITMQTEQQEQQQQRQQSSSGCCSSSKGMDQPTAASKHDNKLIDDSTMKDIDAEPDPDEDMIDCDEERDHSALDSFYRDCIIASGHPNSVSPNVDAHFCRRVRARALPFLRSCALFMYHISLIPFPDNLKTLSAFKRVPDDGARLGHFEQQVEWSNVDEEYNSLCQYLNLPPRFSSLLLNHEARHLIRSWLRHSRVLVLIKSHMKKSGHPLLDDDQLDLETMDDGEMSAAASSSQLLSRSCPTTRSRTRSEQLSDQQQQHQQKHQLLSSHLMPLTFIGQPHPVPRLIELPYDYSELVDRVSSFTCPSIKNQDSRTPTMCLVCGIILCSHSYCCQRDLNDLAATTNLQRRGSSGVLNAPDESSSSPVSWLPAAVSLVTNQASIIAGHLTSQAAANPSLPGAASSSSLPQQNYQQLVGSCTYHAYECSGGVGVFLRIRKCQILMLSGRSKGCYQAAPYNDDHGESDYGLVRGNPLHLNREQYRQIEQAWLTHSIAEQISRLLEHSPYYSSVNWYLH